MLHCVDFVEQVTALEEGRATGLTWLRFHLHRLACAHCRRYLRQMRAVRVALGMLRPDAGPRGELP